MKWNPDNKFKDILHTDTVHQNHNGVMLDTTMLFKYLTERTAVGISPVCTE